MSHGHGIWLDRQNGAGRISHDLFSRGAEEHLTQAGLAPRAENLDQKEHEGQEAGCQQADRERAMRAFEAETLLNLRKGFRRGSCRVDYSNPFPDRDHLLIPAADWEKQKRRHYGLLRLPTNVDDYLNPLIKAAEQGLKAVASALRRGELDIKENDISLDRLEAEGEAPEVAAVRVMIDQEIGSIQLPELMLEMVVAIHWVPE